MCVTLCLQKEFFQDDVYTDTAVCWEPALTASAWLSGSNGQHRKMSLKPKDMTPGGPYAYTLWDFVQRTSLPRWRCFRLHVLDWIVPPQRFSHTHTQYILPKKRSHSKGCSLLLIEYLSSLFMAVDASPRQTIHNNNG